jgi:hypothetical protein
MKECDNIKIHISSNCVADSCGVSEREDWNGADFE